MLLQIHTQNIIKILPPDARGLATFPQTHKQEKDRKQKSPKHLFETS